MRVPQALTSRVTATLVPAAGGGGIGAWLTSITTHRVSTTVLVTGAIVVCLGLAIRGVPKIINALAEAHERRVGADAAAYALRAQVETQSDLLRLGIEPDKAPQAARMVATQALANLPADRELSGAETIKYADRLKEISQDHREQDPGGHGPGQEPGQDGEPGGELRSAG